MLLIISLYLRKINFFDKMGAMKFKVLLFTEFKNATKESGLGKAIRHQEQALKTNNIPYTLNKKDDFDIVHINFYGPNSYALAKKAKRMGKKVVYHAHSTEEDFRNSFILSNKIAPLLKKWLIRCYSLGDAIITPTPYSKRLLEKYGLKNIFAISNGVDTNFFKRDEALGKKFRKKYGFKEDDKVIVGIGLYIERKGILDFIELAKRMPEYKFIWFGHTPATVIPPKISSAIKHAPKNLLFPGHVEAKMIKAALSGADLYVFPTFEETEGIPALEAAACEQKMIVRKIPVFDGWLEDGKSVYMAKDVGDFEKKIKAIIDGKLPDLTKEAKKAALKKDMKKTGEELLEVYEKVLRN